MYTGSPQFMNEICSLSQSLSQICHSVGGKKLLYSNNKSNLIRYCIVPSAYKLLKLCNVFTTVKVACVSIITNRCIYPELLI